MPRRIALITTLIAVCAVAVAACSDSDPAATSTTAATESSAIPAPTAAPDEGNAVAPAGTQAPAAGTADTIAADEFTIPAYSIEAREVSQGGDTVVVLLAPGTYSDLDLENVVADVVERFAPIATVHVVDDQVAVELVLGEPDVLDPAGTDALSKHYFARLEEGFRLVFEGPFTDFPEVILGS